MCIFATPRSGASCLGLLFSRAEIERVVAHIRGLPPEKLLFGDIKVTDP